MSETRIPAENRISKNHRRRIVWQRFVRSMAMIVVFCTTYALILPAITMHSDTICGMESHIHAESCYEVRPVTALTCAHTEEEEHEDACWTETGETVTELICTIPEHTHGDSCYPVEPEATLGISFHCGFGEHTHADTCADAEGSLTCPLSEHVHTAECVVDGLDMAADLESSAVWEHMVRQLNITGVWRQDLLTIARSQLGYTESLRNCVLVNGTLNGYTRYGDWYGNAYQPWDDVFVSFCLFYAGVPDEVIPRESDTGRWLDRLEQMNLLTGAQTDLPQPGDIVFCKNSSGQLYPAILLELTAENTNLDTLQYRVIAGDVNNQVTTVTVGLHEITAVCDPDHALAQYELRTSGVNVDPEETEASEEATEPTEEVTEPTEEVTEPTEEATEPTEEVTEPSEEATEPTEPEATEPAAQTVVHTAETENYIVTVSYPADLILPEGAELRVSEYPKDSEIYRLRCQEAGQELAWLLNIGFFLEDTELPLPGGFDVAVSGRQGDAPGQEIIRFERSGPAPLTVNATGEEESSDSGGYYDFGGVALLAADAGSYSLVTADPSQLQEGVDYIIYASPDNNNVQILLGSTSSIDPVRVTTDYWTSPRTIGNSWAITPAQAGNLDVKNFTWRVVKNGSQIYLVSQSTGQRLYLAGYALSLTASGTSLGNSTNGAATVLSGGNYKLRYNGSDWESSRWYSSNVYFATLDAPEPNYPHAVHTGEVNINRLRFFNLCENGDKGVGPLAGCVFEIKGDNGYTATITSADDPEVHLPADIPDGNYTITEVSAPEGYVRDTEYERTFVIKDGALASTDTIGTFINHNMEQLVASKDAQVEDYANRIYEVNIHADSYLEEYEMDPIDLLFVVDQSNSMLFPSGMVDTGKRVTLRKDGANNAANMDALNLDKSKMHYVIADPTGTSTVWAIWHDGTAWMCQDASYYAKAKHNNDPGYQDDNEIVIFPSDKSYAQQAEEEDVGGVNYRSNGCGLGRDLGSSSLGNYINNNGGSMEFVVYQSTDEYNRLHYLEESLANLIYEMSDVNDKNRITLVRFSRNVYSPSIGPLELTPENVETLQDAVSSIKTSGGTRQDRALEYVYTEHLNDPADHYKDFDHSYTLLITDGAPVRSGDDTPSSVGGAGDAANKNGNTIYSRIKGHAADVRSKSHLMTVALGMENVEAGKAVLEEIATDGSFYCALDDAADLLHQVQKILFESFRPKGEITLYGDIEDEITDSFYPIAWVSKDQTTTNRLLVEEETRNWVLLNENDWITLDGKLTTAGAADAAGQLLKREDGTYYVRWANQSVTRYWKGTFYVKAKEDFVGGNVIDTNKDAGVSIYRDMEEGTPHYLGEKTFETPTVNVRLLPLNEMNSEVTVYLGDQVNGEGNSPLDSLKYFYENTRFTKLISDGGDILNQVSVDGINGLEEAVFYLRYAMGADLTEEQWQMLANGDSIVVPYTYDDASSHGAVGEFTFRLEKSGLGSSYLEHTAVAACQPGGQPLTEDCDSPAEVYTLHITYEAYGLGEEGRPGENVYNGTGSPGTEVGTGTTLETGLGTLEKENVHEVHVISGKIEITKRFGEGTTDEADRTFTFTLHRVEDGPITTNDRTATITIPAGATQGSASIVFDNLPRGTYTVTEAVDEDYTLESITVLDSTNCYSEPAIGSSATQVTFVMGNNTANENVIGRADESDLYTSYIDPVNGVYGAAEFTNGPIVYPAQLPVEKHWLDSEIDHSGDAVYLVLYLNDAPVLDGDGNARILRLDTASGWKGYFTINLADENDDLSNYNYSVREASQVSGSDAAGWNAAILENDGTVIYYEKALSEGSLFTVNGKAYVVAYGVGESGQLTVTNYWATILPETGGRGTHLYTFSGLLLMLAAALIFGYNQRRRMERGASR